MKFDVHNYICNICGTVKSNEQVGRSWLAVWTLPNGRVAVGATPPCVVGELTPLRLATYQREPGQEG